MDLKYLNKLLTLWRYKKKLEIKLLSWLLSKR